MFSDTIMTKRGPVLITGHTGFKGTWLSLLLQKLGIAHHGYSLEAEKGSLYRRLESESVFPGTIGDIRYLSNLRRCFFEVNPSVVIHMAAQPLVLKSYRAPLQTFETNVLGTANVLEAAFESPNVEIILVITTDKVYQNDNSGRRFKESDPLAGKDPYSASKVGAETVCAAWQQISKTKNGPKVIVARAGNVIGGGDFADDRIIPDLIRGVILNESTIIRNAQATRPWQHVLDPLVGYLRYIEETMLGRVDLPALNFGPFESSLRVQRILEIGQEVFGKDLRFQLEESSTNKEAQTLELDASLAHNELGWSPFWNQEDAIFETFKWWKLVIQDNDNASWGCMQNIQSILNHHK